MLLRCAGRKIGWIVTTTRRRQMPEQIVGKPATADQVLAEGNLQATSRRRAVIRHALWVFDIGERMARRSSG